MMLYVYDQGWKGATVVTAESREQASELSGNYVKPEDWDEYKLGEAVYTVGDC